MPSDNSTTGAVMVDPKKSPEQYMQEAEIMYIVPQLIREKYPDLIKLIYETESMDDEEREYWLQIMPIMTDDQISKFRDILVNEKVQLQKLDKEYDDEMRRINSGQKTVRTLDEAKMKEKMEEIKAAESAHQEEEESEEEALLEELEGL